VHVREKTFQKLALTTSPHIDNTGFVTGLTILSCEFCFPHVGTLVLVMKTTSTTEEKALTVNIF
jgi:hypothetical protein